MKLFIKLFTTSLLVFLIYTMYAATQEDTNLCKDTIDLYNVKFLRDGKKVREKLAGIGFSSVEFSTSDNIQLAGLFLDRKQQQNISPQGTLIFCAGFHPGLKEGMATFYEMLKEQPYNFLFFDHRGHGQSKGESYFSISGLQNYGKNEYKDVLAAIEFVDSYNHEHAINTDIIIFGLCSGGYHTIRALDYLYEQQSPQFHEVKKVIIDSGWESLESIGSTTIHGELEYRFTSFGASLVKYPLYLLLNSLYYLLFHSWHKQLPSLIPMMDHLDQEILFVHAKNDLHAPLGNVEKMIPHCKHCQTWFIEKSTHACNHLKCKEIYKEKLDEFLHQS